MCQKSFVLCVLNEDYTTAIDKIISLSIISGIIVKPKPSTNFRWFLFTIMILTTILRLIVKCNISVIVHTKGG